MIGVLDDNALHSSTGIRSAFSYQHPFYKIVLACHDYSSRICCFIERFFFVMKCVVSHDVVMLYSPWRVQQAEIAP